MKVSFLILVVQLTAFCQVKDIYYFGSKVNDYIADNLEPKDEIGYNLSILDSIFAYSLQIADSNISDALLFCSIGTMTYPVFRVKIPGLGLLFPFKFFYKIDSISFNRKLENLPSKLFNDSPQTKFGDKDKIVHFFSTAYLSYTLGEKVSSSLGLFVEQFEEDFKIDGKVDKRDLRINELGIEFGKALHFNLIYPSFILAKVRELSYGQNFSY